MNYFIWVLADRIKATETIANITTGVHFENITNQWGASNVSFNDTPNWGRIIWELISVYPEFMDMIAWVIIFSLPFVMMWLAHADMTAAGAVGIFMGLYVFFFIPSEWVGVAIIMFVIAGAALLYPIWRRYAGG